jgi:hypothetical protein
MGPTTLVFGRGALAIVEADLDGMVVAFAFI